MKAAFLTSSLIASKGKAAPASPAMTPRNLLDSDEKSSSGGVSRIYDRVREYADPHMADENGKDTGNGYQEKQAAENGVHSSSITETRSIYPRIGNGDNDSSRDYSPESAKPKASPVPEQQSRYSIVNTVTRALSTPKRQEPLPNEKYEEIAEEVSKLKKDGLGRIRISVRMSPKDHLQLKLIAAHTQMSAQSIFETALEEYVANHGTEILPQSCNCVLDKSSL
ncbi:MAG: hypothetical protein K9G33_05315 [Sneathiella sp.]|nr:hypothetical protein [Sneathiella sp.]